MNAAPPQGAVILPFPSVRAGSLTLDRFEASAAAFQAGTLPADQFLDLCNQAIKVVGNYRYKKTIYQYRYLAHMALGNYYDATADASVILAVYQDPIRHYEMMCSLCLRRSNYFKALEYVDKLMAAAPYEGVDPEFYREERNSLAAFTAGIPCLSALEFAAKLGGQGEEAAAPFRGRPVMLFGRGWIGVNQESQTRFLTFHNTGSHEVRCRFPANEAPFLRTHITGQHIRLCGYYAFTAPAAVYLNPCYFVDRRSDL